MMKKPLYMIAGPTATGKSALAIELAKKLDGEIISGDSMQVYRGMDIGTAKIRPEEMQGIPHHLSTVWTHGKSGMSRGLRRWHGRQPKRSGAGGGSRSLRVEPVFICMPWHMERSLHRRRPEAAAVGNWKRPRRRKAAHRSFTAASWRLIPRRLNGFIPTMSSV